MKKHNILEFFFVITYILEFVSGIIIITYFSNSELIGFLTFLFVELPLLGVIIFRRRKIKDRLGSYTITSFLLSIFPLLIFSAAFVFYIINHKLNHKLNMDIVIFSLAFISVGNWFYYYRYLKIIVNDQRKFFSLSFKASIKSLLTILGLFSIVRSMSKSESLAVLVVAITVIAECLYTLSSMYGFAINDLNDVVNRDNKKMSMNNWLKRFYKTIVIKNYIRKDTDNLNWLSKRVNEKYKSGIDKFIEHEASIGNLKSISKSLKKKRPK